MEISDLGFDADGGDGDGEAPSSKGCLAIIGAVVLAGALGWGIWFWNGPEGRLRRSHEINEGEYLDLAEDHLMDEVWIEPRWVSAHLTSPLSRDGVARSWVSVRCWMPRNEAEKWSAGLPPGKVHVDP